MKTHQIPWVYPKDNHTASSNCPQMFFSVSKISYMSCDSTQDPPFRSKTMKTATNSPTTLYFIRSHTNTPSIPIPSNYLLDIDVWK